jgi:hypothetical protein
VADLKRSAKHPMKNKFLTLSVALICTILVNGCKTITPTSLKEAYSQVQVGMTEKEVTQILGAPMGSVGRTLRWEAAQGPEYYADYIRVEVLFDGNGRVGDKKIRGGRQSFLNPDDKVQAPK